jgi:uncharacterized protein (DUF2141 family)
MSIFISVFIKIAAMLCVQLLPSKQLPIITQNNAATLMVRTTNLRSSKGTWRIAVYNSPQNFLSDTPPFAAIAPIRNNKSDYTFVNLPAGDYEVAVYHDENNNTKMDYWLGVPTEGIGFSNNPSILGKPSLKECKFTIKVGETRVLSIQMKYLL